MFGKVSKPPTDNDDIRYWRGTNEMWAKIMEAINKEKMVRPSFAEYLSSLQEEPDEGQDQDQEIPADELESPQSIGKTHTARVRRKPRPRGNTQGVC